MKKLMNRVLPSVAVLAAIASPAAFASPESEAAFTSIATEASTLLAAAWPIAVTIVVGTIGIKLFKKFASKAT